MLEAFKALLTKRRETHSLAVPAAAAAVTEGMPRHVTPRLRMEPNPTYFLRTARSYVFLESFLEASLGEATLKSLHGLRETGPRDLDLSSELKRMRELFYGLYLMSAEDLGMKPGLMDGETIDRAACERTASEWLMSLKADPDLAVDTRVAVPVYYNPQSGSVRLWMTIGVRLTPLEATYARGPRIKPKDGSGDWKPVEESDPALTSYLIPVDEFAEVELTGGKVLTRAELRAICDQAKTRDAILDAFKKL
jgi:hypothetical protein